MDYSDNRNGHMEEKMKTKKWIIIPIVFLLVIQPFYSIIGSSSKAAAQGIPFVGGDGTSENPYQIATAEQLNEVRNYLDKDFVLIADIDLEGYSNWVPIAGFRGSFNGDWHVISNLKIIESNNNTGLFSFVDNATLKNFTLKDAQINGANQTAILAGQAYNSTVIEGVTIDGGTVNATGGVAGGLVGYAANVIFNKVSSSATVSSSADNVGGLIGFSQSANTLKDAYSTGNVTGSFNVGGLIGQANNSIIENTYATGKVVSNGNGGGLIGSIDTTVTNSFYDLETTSLIDDSGKGSPKTTEDMKLESTYTNWGFGDTWGLDQNKNNGYPYLLSSNTNLSNLTIPLFSVNESFSPNKLDYTVTVPIGTTEIALSATPADIKVSVTIPGAVDDSVALDSDGQTTISVEVKAEDGTTKTYMITVVTEATLSNNANLSNLTLSQGTLSPSFALGTTEYKASVGNEISSIEVTPMLDDSTATMTVNGSLATSGNAQNVSLNVGENLITIVVTAQDGKTTTYTIEVTRGNSLGNGEDPDSNAGNPPSENSCISGLGDGLTPENPIIICTAEDLDNIRNGMDKHYKLGQDIDLESYVSEGGPAYNNGKGWAPIGSMSEPFTGTLDGNNFEIKNLKINRPNEMFVGLFGGTYDPAWDQEANMNNGVIDFSSQRITFNNIKLRNVNIIGDYTVGALAASISRGGINNSSVTGIVEGISSVGDLAGNNAYTFISRSWSDATVIGKVCDPTNLYIACGTTGGLVGHNSGQITESFAVGDVNGLKNVGGLVGVGWNYDIINSYSAGTVTGKMSVGGIVGSLDHSTDIINSYSISKVYPTPDSESTTIGGLVGAPYSGPFGEPSGPFITFGISSYWDVTVSSIEARESEYGTPVTNSLDMMKKSTFVNWDTENVWYITCDGESGYPALKWMMSEIPTDRSCSGSGMENPNEPETPEIPETETPSVPETPNTGGSETETPSKPHTGGNKGGSGNSSSNTEIITVDVDGKNGENLNKTPIKRTTESNGVVKDFVTMPDTIAKDTVQKAKESGNDTARIIIPDDKDIVSETNVEVPKSALTELKSGELNLDIYTENATVSIPKASLKDFNEDLYFRLIPIKKEAQRKEVEDRARVEKIVKDMAQDQSIEVVARPMTIETNMQNRPVTLILPLRNVQLPTDEAEREKFLKELVIFIEHSDGEKELVKANVVQYNEGQLGLEFGVNKFSTFTILHMEGFEEEAAEHGTHTPYIIGFGTEFRPNQPVTRAQMARMLARNLDATPSTQAYADIPATHWVYNEVMEVKGAGIMTGKTATTFDASGHVTRAQMAGIAYRWIQNECGKGANAFDSCAKLKNIPNANFTDVSSNHWAFEAINFMKDSKMMEGFEDNTFRPNENLTRAQAVKVLNDLFKRGPLTGIKTPSFEDVTPAHWAFEEIEEAARTHTINFDENGQEILK